MKMLHKAGAGGNGLEFVLSDATKDADGDIIDPAGWDLSRFKSNPVALWDHGKDAEIGRTPIGRWVDTRVAKGQMVSRLDPAKGVLSKIDAIITLIERDFLRATSVGFQPLEWEPINPKEPWAGQRYLKQSLLEASIVAVPSNSAALALAKSLDLDPEFVASVFGARETESRSEEPTPPATSGKEARVVKLNDPARDRARAKPFVIRRIIRG